MPTVVFFDRNDVLNRAATPSSAVDAIVMSPSARAAAQEAGISVKDTLVFFSDYGHARCVAAARVALQDFDRAMLEIDLSPGITLVARHAIWSITCLVHRLNLTLPNGPYLVRERSGQWVRAEDWQALQQVMLPRIWDCGITDRALNGRSPLLPTLYKWLTRFTAVLARKRHQTWIASSTPKLKNGLREALVATGASMAVLQPTGGSLADYRLLSRNLRSSGHVQRFLIAPFAADDIRVKKTLTSLMTIGASISDEHVRAAWAIHQPYLALIVPTLLALASEGSVVMRMLRVRSAITYEANSFLTTALLQAAGDAGVTRVVFNHNSQPSSSSAIAESVLETLFRHRTWNNMVDVVALWSPASQQRIPEPSLLSGERLLTTLPVCIKYPLSKESRSTRPFRILHAGNYQNWSDFFPWIAETSDEYMNGMGTLATAVEKLDDVELVIRVRPKREVDSAAVTARLGKRRNVIVCNTDQDFLEQLADSDLLICHFSTTVEQALQMGKPVLLWGNALRYQQFVSRETAPSKSSRSAVYAVRRAEELSAMLIAIRDAHRDAPLSADEVDAYRFAPDTPGIECFAEQLVRTSFMNVAAPAERI